MPIILSAHPSIVLVCNIYVNREKCPSRGLFVSHHNRQTGVSAQSSAVRSLKCVSFYLTKAKLTSEM